MVPCSIHDHAKQYMSESKRVRKDVEEAMFCIRHEVAVQHNFSPQFVKNIFNLEESPIEITIEPLGNH